MARRHDPRVRFIAAYAAWVFTVNTLPGPWRRWSRGARIDNWTWTHVAFGALARQVGLSLPEITALGVLNEAIEAGLRARRPDLLWGEPETRANVAVDLAANAAGWLLADRATARDG